MKHNSRYLPDNDQLALASSLSKPLLSLLPLARLHESPCENEETWSQLVSLGIFAIGLDEEVGGIGLGATEETLIALELGRHLAGPSVFATLGATHARTEGTIIPQRTVPAYLRGDGVVIVGDILAEQVLLRAGTQTALYPMILGSKPLESQLWLDSLRLGHLSDEPVATFDQHALLRLTLIDAAALSGIAQRALDMAVIYAELREQFGKPIGSFQAIKHHCANMAISAQRACDLVQFAAVAVDDDREDAALLAASALLVASQAARDNAALNIQIHGGIGFSKEADPHLLVKRAQILTQIAGGLDVIGQGVAETRVDCCPMALGGSRW